MIREGITQGNPLSTILYGITLVPLAEEICITAPDLLATFYADDADFDRPEDWGAHLM